MKYNRELMAKTLQAMKRVSEIQQVREKRFYEKRWCLVCAMTGRMALAKEHQRLSKKVVIARVGVAVWDDG